MTPTLQQLEQARATYTEQWQRALCASQHDPRIRHHVDILRQSMEECDALIRDERLALQIDAQRAIAPASTKFGSMTHPVKTGTVRKRR